VIKKLLYKLGNTLPCRLINIDGHPYLERYYIGKAFGVTFYLHRFVSADTERNVHDHPWSWAAALVLAGGYREERLRYFDLKRGGWASKNKNLYPGKVNRISASTFHRIGEAKPETYTLFVHGARVKGWGFLESFEHTGGRGTKPSVKPGVMYHQPYDLTVSDWHKTAPEGRFVGREGFNTSTVRQ
jgi:hypothetical protein